MEQLEELKNWIMGFPLWGDVVLTVDITGAEPGACGLFPVGMEQLSLRQDVLGQTVRRLRQQFLLRRQAVRGQDAAGWLLEFQKWAAENAHLAPQFGAQQQLRAEKGRLVTAAQTGLGLYEVRLTVEYTDNY